MENLKPSLLTRMVDHFAHVALTQIRSLETVLRRMKKSTLKYISRKFSFKTSTMRGRDPFE